MISPSIGRRTACGRDIIVIGASAGGIQVLEELVAGLPEDLAAAIFVVVHTSPVGGTVLPSILDRKSRLPARMAEDGEPIRHGVIYLAPPDHHLLVKPGLVCCSRGPRENGFRPAIDPLFRTAARAYRSRVVAVVLSGGMDDGTAGIVTVKEYGGIAIAQDPVEAVFDSMPRSAIENAGVDHVLRIAQMPATLAELSLAALPQGALDMARPAEVEPDVAEIGTAALKTHELSGAPSTFVCPECGGSLWEIREGSILRYRCHVGHGYTAEALLSEQNGHVEDALWTALRALEENAALRRRMAERVKKGKLHHIVEHYTQQAHAVEEKANVLRRLLLATKSEVRKMPATSPTYANRDKPSDGGNGNGNGNGQRNGNGSKRGKRKSARHGKGRKATRTRVRPGLSS
jgi:two-component system chemotaxis response regulator CheB